MTRIACLAFVLASASIARADGGKLHPAQWTFTFGIQSPSGQAMAPPQTQTKCVTPEQAKDPVKQVQFPPGCEASQVKLEGSTLRWALSCHMGGGSQKGSGTVHFTPDTMTNDGTITVEIPNHGNALYVFAVE